MIGVAKTLTIRVPITVQKRGGRKVVVLPESVPGGEVSPLRVNNTLVKALARAFRWRRMLETGRYGTITDLAAAEKINESYVSRVLRLTLLAPDIVEAILDGRQTENVTLPMLMQPFSVEWQVQRASCS